QLSVVARPWQRELPHVEVEVEVGVVDPVRVVEAERHLGEPPAERGQQRQALLHEPLYVAGVELAARSARGIENRHARHVAGLARALERQELRVHAGQLPHPLPLMREFGRITTWRAS